jgi:hypothetical protein
MSVNLIIIIKINFLGLVYCYAWRKMPRIGTEQVLKDRRLEMAKKKNQNPNKTRNTIILSTIAGVVVIAVGVIVTLSILWSGSIMKFYGKDVPVSQYELILYQNKYNYESYFGTEAWGYPMDESGTTLAQTVAQDSLNALVNQKIARREFENRGLTISEADKTSAKEELDYIKSTLSDKALDWLNMSDEEMLELLDEMGMYNALYADITKDFVFDETAFEEYYDKYLVDNERTLTKINVNYIYNIDEEKVKEARAALLDDNADVYELIKQYSVDYAPPETEGAEDVRLAPQDIASVTLAPEELIANLYTEEMEGAITDIYPVKETTEEGEESTVGYIFVKVDSITYPDYETLKEEQRTAFETQEKDAIFQPAFQALTDEADKNIKINEKYLSTVDVATLPN